jgi:Zn-dependent peptidase ImmA (M78 family)
MHEFGHALDGVNARDYVAATRGGAARSFEEYLADHFAVHILMPEGWVRALYPRLKRVDTMAWRFGVSMETMRLRLGELALRKDREL